MTEATETRRRFNHAIWLGPLVVFAGFVSYYMFFVRFPTLRDFPWFNLPLLLLGLGLSLLGVWRAFARPGTWGRVLGTLGLVFSLLVFSLFNFYVFSLSYRMPGPNSLNVELARAPDISLVDHAGQQIQLRDLRGKKVVLVFYRGYW
jgi:hypothetical protein